MLCKVCAWGIVVVLIPSQRGELRLRHIVSRHKDESIAQGPVGSH